MQRAGCKAAVKSQGKRKLINKLNDLTSKEWLPETVSVFVQRGLGQNHPDTKIEREHPAPFSFQDVGRLIAFFTKEGQNVLDPFCGVGSTLKACAIANRNGYGIELVERYCELARRRLREEVEPSLLTDCQQHIIQGDARDVIRSFDDAFFDFVVTSPPYWNILHKIDHKAKGERIRNGLETKYSDDPRDFGNIRTYERFLNLLVDFFHEISRVLKHKGYLCVILSDFRHKGRYHMFHADLANGLEQRGYVLKGITILYQKHKKVYPYGYPYSYVPNIHHQYIAIFENHAPQE